MDNLRTYGCTPYQIAAIHGGPGAPGEMAPVARKLAPLYGVLEPLQTKATIQGQLEELKTILEEHGQLPITLIGYSWGAMLSYFFTGHNPALVKKLILVSSGPFEEHYASTIMETRLSRLTEAERARLDSLTLALADPNITNKDAIFAQMGELDSKADAFNPLPHEDDIIAVQSDIFESIWSEAQALRKSGELLAVGQHISCPVVAIHGDYDPHPAEGIATPLSKVLKDFHFHLLERCGHSPWYEREAREPFYALLKQEL